MHNFDQLRKHAQLNGVQLPDDLLFSDRFIAFHDVSSTKRNLDCRYMLQEVGSNHVVCDYGSWKGKWENYKWRSWQDDSELSEEDLEQFRKSQAELKAAREKQQAEAAVSARELWNELEGADPEHPYLKRKGIKPHMAREKDGWLYVPIHDIDTLEIKSLQRINAEGQKRFMRGADAKGYLMLGEMDGATQVYIAEGYATACTIYEATQEPTICAFSCSNCAWVATNMADMYPGIEWVLCQDQGDAGEKLGADWAEMGLGRVCVPPQMKQGNDWNDYAQDHSLQEIEKLLKPQAYTSMSLDAFMRKDVPPNEWVVENMFSKTSINILFGAPGSGKSWACMHMATASAMGVPIFGRQTKKQKILVIDGELTAPVLKQRWGIVLNSWDACQTADMIPPSIVSTLSFEEDEEKPPINLYNPMSRSMLDAHIANHDLIILDNYTALTERGGGEDFRDDERIWDSVFNWMRSWSSKGKTWIIVMHTNKGNELSGTGRISAKVWTIIKVARPLKALKTLPDSISFVLTFTKNRTVEEGYVDPFGVEILTPEQCRAGGHKEPFIYIDGSREKLETIEKTVDLTSFTEVRK